MKLLIVYPTRQRRKLFFETLDNIEATIGTDNYSIIINADNDDLSMNDTEVINKIKHDYKNCTIYFNEPVSKIAAVNANIDKQTDWDWCIVVSDDQKFIVNDWYEKMISDIKSVWGDSLDFFAHFDDSFVGEKLPTMSIMGKEYYQRFNYIYHPSYGSVSVDAEQMLVAMMLGRHHYFPKVYARHLHPSNLNTGSDLLYRKNDFWGEKDTANYFERMKRYFDVPESERLFIPDILQKEIDNLK